MLLDNDLKAIEMAVKAFLTQDPVMVDEVNNDKDMHADTCVNLMERPLTKENRTAAKPFNFRAIYCNMDYAAKSFCNDPAMPNFPLKKWESIVDNYCNKYKGMMKAHEEDVWFVRKHGFYVGPTGRIWKFHKKKIYDGSEDYSKEQIYNYKTQGTAADIIKLATYASQKRIEKAGIPKDKVLLCMRVHDSLIRDVHPDYVEQVNDIVVQTFRDLPNLLNKLFNIEWNVKLDGDGGWGDSWSEC